MLSEKRLFHLRKSAAKLCIVLSIALSSPPILSSAAERSYAREIGQYVGEDKVYLLENIRENITRPSEKIVVDALLCESGPEAIELFQRQLKEYPDPLLNKLSSARIAAYSMALYGTITPPKLSQPLPQAKPKLAEVQDTTKQSPAPPLQKKTKSETVASLVPLPKRPKRDSLPPAPPLPEKPKSETIAALTPLPEKPKRNTVPLLAQLPAKSIKEPATVKMSGFTLQFGSFANKENAKSLAQKVSLFEPAKIIQQGEFYKVILKNKYASKEEVSDIVKKMPFIAIIVPANIAER